MGRAHFAKLAGALWPAASNLCVFVHHEINTAKWMIILGIIEFLTTHELRTQMAEKGQSKTQTRCEKGIHSRHGLRVAPRKGSNDRSRRNDFPTTTLAILDNCCDLSHDN